MFCLPCKPGFVIMKKVRSFARLLSGRMDRYPRLQSALKEVFLQLPASLRGRQLIRDHLKSLPKNQTFLLVGANDGVTNDHVSPFVHHRGWRGAAVEPVLQYFQQLQAHYDGQPVTCLNVAVHDTATSLPFYWLEDSAGAQIPAFAKGVGSFSRANVELVIAEHPEFASSIRERQVPCMSLATIVKTAALPVVDVLVVDTEGYDAQVILQADFNAWKTHTVIFEHKLLPADEMKQATDFLEQCGFRCESDSFDTLATRKPPV